MKIGIIIQARTGSTRLPNKVLKPFYQKKGILELLVERLKNIELPVIIATSTQPQDNAIEKLSQKLGAFVYRGSENNVLQRFIEAAEKFDLTHVIRVCSDNPFLDIAGIEELIQDIKKNTKLDYLSYTLDGSKPTILSHIGTFVELTRLVTLKKAHKHTDEPLYLEHVTNFIYKHPDLFSIKLLPAPTIVLNQNNIRLTLDTQVDFENLQQLYHQVIEEKDDICLEYVMEVLKDNPMYLVKMEEEINKNKK